MHRGVTEEARTITGNSAGVTVCGRPEVWDALVRGDWSIVLRAFLDAGLSQTVIAARTGLSQSQVSRLASGQSKTPGIKTVKALCDGLAVPRRLAGLADDASQGASSSADHSVSSRPWPCHTATSVTSGC
jgi:ribosome-binding protein aMBF1 (putative translation factor)